MANEFLCQLEQCQIDEMIRSMSPLEASEGTLIIRQGEHGSELYVLQGICSVCVLSLIRVAEGRVQVSKDSRFLRIMDAPCVFGELAILYNCERTASVKGNFRRLCSI